MKLYAPFPSRIVTETSGTSVIITWKDAKDVIDGSYEIYRAGKAITADNLNLAEKIGESASGIQTYRDTPPIDTELFYAVFAKENTQTYKICIPYRNVTTTAIKIEKSDIEETISTTISSLTATTMETEVNLHLQSSIKERKIIIFRSTSILDTYDNLIKSINVAEESGSIIDLKDTPMAGIKYYYAAVDGDLYRSGSKNLLYEGNYTKKEVQVKFPHEVAEESLYIKSTMPLPLLKVSADLESGELLYVQKKPAQIGSISSENIKAVLRLIDKKKFEFVERPAAVLAYNRNINHIIGSFFLNKNWSETVSQLKNFTSLNYDKNTRIQSHFYRGQAYFFMSQYNNALLEFIMIEKDLYVETKPWFNAIYQRIKNPAARQYEVTPVFTHSWISLHLS